MQALGTAKWRSSLLAEDHGNPRNLRIVKDCWLKGKEPFLGSGSPGHYLARNSLSKQETSEQSYQVPAMTFYRASS